MKSESDFALGVSVLEESIQCLHGTGIYLHSEKLLATWHYLRSALPVQRDYLRRSLIENHRSPGQIGPFDKVEFHILQYPR